MAKTDKMLITMLALNKEYLNLGQKEITDGTDIYRSLTFIYPSTYEYISI